MSQCQSSYKNGGPGWGTHLGKD